MNEITCPKCGGSGQIPNVQPFTNAGERPPESKDCDECGGKGFIYPRFFVQFFFDYEFTGRKYWLPVFVAAENVLKANELIKAFRKGLDKHFKDISMTFPIVENKIKSEIEKTYAQYRAKKLVSLDVQVWTIKDIVPNPDWNFNEHLNYIGENLPLSNRVVAECREQHRFPVRVIKEGNYPIDFNEFLIVDIVKPDKI